MTTAEKTKILVKSDELLTIQNLVAEELAHVEQHMDEFRQSQAGLINEIIEYLIFPHGKRVRPLTLILMARALNYRGTSASILAAMIEFIHTATLLHDDVVDESELRRGKKTANKVWGNAAGVLVGDFLYTRVFHIIGNIDDIPQKEIFISLADTTNQVVEGEVLQLMQRYNAEIDEATHLKILQYKTGKLFQLATHFGSILAGADLTIQNAACDYGLYVGTAFQLVDDMLDYSNSPEKTGKNIGDDLADGSPTMPLIYAYRHGNEEERNTIRLALEHGDLSKINEIKHIIKKNCAAEYTLQLARQQAELAIQALDKIPSSKYRDGLIALAKFSVSRDY